MALSNPSEITVSDSEFEFVKNVETCLEKGEVQWILHAFQDKQYECVIENNCSKLISVLIKFYSIDFLTNSQNIYQCCSDLINVIAEKCEPLEVILQLLEEFEKIERDYTYLLLLKPVQTVLKRSPPQKVNSFVWCYHAVNDYLKKLPLPKEHVSSEEEMNSDDFIRITSLYFEVINFYRFITVELKNEHRDVVLKYLLDLLGKPLSHLNMDMGNGRIIAEEIVSLIFQICTDPYMFLEIQLIAADLLDEPLSELCLGVLYYLIADNQKFVYNIPKIYNPVYVFQNSLKFVSELLFQENQFCIEKGLFLANHILKSVRNSNLTGHLLESTEHNRFCKILTIVIIYNQIEKVRKTAFQLFQTYLSSFDLHGRYLIIYNSVNTLDHTGLIGFLITYFKDMLASEMARNEIDLPIYFKSEKLRSILFRFCYLPKNEESDIIKLADQIIATLNLMRYLVIRDKNNVTSFNDYIPNLEKQYLEPLKKAIILSRAHYKLKLELIEENKKSRKEEPLFSITAYGQPLVPSSTSEKIELVMSSLTALDVMDSLLCRLNECIDSNLVI